MKHPGVSRLHGHRPLWRLLFWLYFVVLTTALLWPQLALPPVVPRPDLIVHCVSFGLFALLLCLWNPTKTSRLGTKMVLAFVAGTSYGGMTELLQSIPVLHRTAAIDDWGADVLGVVCGLLAYWGLQRWLLSRCAPARQ